MGSTGKSTTQSVTSGVTDFKGLQTLVKDRYGIKWQPSMKDFPLDFQKDLVEQLEHAVSEFPEIKDKIKTVTLTRKQTDMGLVDGGKQDGALLVSDNYLNYDMKNPWATGNGVNQRSFTVDYFHQLLSHEVGHAVERAIGINGAIKATSGISGLSTLSRYANEYNTSEQFAEAIADYLIHKNKANKISIAVAKQARQLLDKKKSV